MGKDNVIAIKKPEPFVDDPISAVLRQGARSLKAQALEIEIETFPFLHKTRSIEHLIPWLYLKVVSTGDFSDALAALVGHRHRGCRLPPTAGSKPFLHQKPGPTRILFLDT